MRFLLTALILFLTAAPVLAQQTFTIGTPLTSFWTAAPNELATQVDHYEVRLDAPGTNPEDTVWVHTMQSVPQAEYTFPLPQPRLNAPGAYVISLRACRATTCTPDNDLAVVNFSMTLGVPGRPGAPGVRPTPSVAVEGTVDHRGNAFGLDVATNTLDGLPSDFKFYFGAPTLTVPGYSVEAGDRFYFEIRKQ